MPTKEEIASENTELKTQLGDKEKQIVERDRQMAEKEQLLAEQEEEMAQLRRQLAEAKKPTGPPAPSAQLATPGDDNPTLAEQMAEMRQQFAEFTKTKIDEMNQLKAQLAEKDLALSKAKSTAESGKTTDLTEDDPEVLRMELAERKRRIALLRQQSATSMDADTYLSSEEKQERSNIKFPPFMQDATELWFAQVELLFNDHKITSENTKYEKLAGALENRVAREVSDLIRTRPTKKPYTTLKNELIHRLSKSEEARLLQLAAETEMGDMTPSQFLRHLQNMVPQNLVDERMMRTFWIKGLPADIQGIVKIQPSTTTLTELAKTADKMMETYPTSKPSVYAASLPEAPPSSNQIAEMLQKMMDKFEIKMKTEMDSAIDKIQKSVQESNNRGRYNGYGNRSRSRTPGSHNGICFYHNKYGDKAFTCRKPCKFEPKKESTNANGSQ